MLWRFVRAPATYRGWAWHIVGGALLMPYLMAVEVIVVAVGDGDGFGSTLLLAQLPLYVAALPLVAVTAVLLPIRAANRMLARTLLSADIPDPMGPVTMARRIRHAAWFTVHLAWGALVSGVSLALVPFAVFLVVRPFLAPEQRPAPLPPGQDWLVWGGPVIGPLLVLALIALVAGSTRVLRPAAGWALGPSAAEREAIARRDARDLAARNRIARELHDSIGHALSTVTVQSAAARRVLDHDPAFVATALAAVEDTARRALEDLDAVLGVLRERDDGTGPVRTLDDLETLLDSCGVSVDARVEWGTDPIPPVISREAYRIVQESLTNALRHGADATAELELSVADQRLRLTVSNPVPDDAAATEPGRGITGMAERAAVLGGALTAERHDGRWVVSARLPVGSQP